MSEEENELDVILANADRHGVPEFLEAVAGFLRRKTDFFTCNTTRDWEKLLLDNRIQIQIQNLKRRKLLKESASSKATAPVTVNEETTKPIAEVGGEVEKSESGKLKPNAGNGCT